METITITPSFVGFFDILGYNEIVKNNSHEALVKFYSDFNLKKNQGFELIKKVINEKIIPDYSNSSRVNAIIISDSIILWTIDSSINSLIEILTISISLISGMFFKGFPLRGGISLGDITEITDGNHRNLIGNGLTNAYNCQKIQDWSGCIIDEKVFQEFDNSNPDTIILKDYIISRKDFIFNYNVPLKSGEVKPYLTFNWCSVFDTFELSDIEFNQLIRAFFTAHNKIQSGWDVERKILNTIEFIEYCRKNIYK